MGSLRDLDIAPVYGGTSGSDALSDFLIPALSVGKKYDRVAGYFSSAVFAQIATGITPLVKSGGLIRLLTSHSLTERDIEAMQAGKTIESSIQVLADEFEQAISQEGTDLRSRIKADYVRAMCWLLKHGQLEIKIVVPSHLGAATMEKFHSKFGLIVDAQGDVAAFSGSVNETWLAWARNLENVSVYKSWVDGLTPYVNSYRATFEDMWNGNISADWKTIELPEALRKNLVSYANEGDFPDIEAWETGERQASQKVRTPRKYQELAVEAWEKSGRVGLLEMATGTGKTFTANLCIQSALSEGTLCGVVIAPYQHIADQWAKELSEFSPFQVGARGDWRQELQRLEFESSLDLHESLIMIVVKNTAASADFVEATKRIAAHFDNFLLVGDEVHWLGAPSLQSALNLEANFRLGLSATPDRYFDSAGSNHLKAYFGGNSVYKFGLEEALNWIDPDTGVKGVLAPYEYHPRFVELTRDEETDFSDLSKKIAQKSNKKDKTPEDFEEIERLLLRRADIVKKAKNKIPAYEALLQEIGESLTQAIIYCADFEQMERVMNSSRFAGIDTASRITGLEGSSKSEYFQGLSEREHILKNFALGNHSALFAIDCLDEGVDVPSATIGIILASSGNPKEFIQRRGRLMRKALGKDRAVIYDFVVVPPDGDGPESLKRIELKRILEFAGLAVNATEVEALITKNGMGE